MTTFDVHRLVSTRKTRITVNENNLNYRYDYRESSIVDVFLIYFTVAILSIFNTCLHPGFRVKNIYKNVRFQK